MSSEETETKEQEETTEEQSPEHEQEEENPEELDSPLSKTDEEIKKLMVNSNRMPSLQ